MLNRHTVKTPRRERADRLPLILLWAEAGAEFRREFRNNFASFERYADAEARRLIASTSLRGGREHPW